jgi:hypothetical protein
MEDPPFDVRNAHRYCRILKARRSPIGGLSCALGKKRLECYVQDSAAGSGTSAVGEGDIEAELACVFGLKIAVLISMTTRRLHRTKGSVQRRSPKEKPL